MRRRTAWTGVAAVGALLAVACGGDGEGGADPVPTTQGVVPLVATVESFDLAVGPADRFMVRLATRDLRPVAYGTVRLELRFLDETNPVPLESAGVPKGAIDSRGATTGKVPDPSCIASPWPRRSPTSTPPPAATRPAGPGPGPPRPVRRRPTAGWWPGSSPGPR